MILMFVSMYSTHCIVYRSNLVMEQPSVIVVRPLQPPETISNSCVYCHQTPYKGKVVSLVLLIRLFLAVGLLLLLLPMSMMRQDKDDGLDSKILGTRYLETDLVIDL